ncbi:hypothetical protein RFI_27078 [Reticulomyxa filosa]|uniref:Mitochondrial import inner membrane translocase subunit TIM50 n=1 Tax=Reticulomyxa filosa TaxID=46433 RepID=X6M9I0_RETFI|nr:hypothetical protein RFI_27078 [Reticulomyxa filosa]|eukprot:ETO10296.1 hypothetical protein RFI_27078 [Reticulomyxa filosa]
MLHTIVMYTFFKTCWDYFLVPIFICVIATANSQKRKNHKKWYFVFEDQTHDIAKEKGGEEGTYGRVDRSCNYNQVNSTTNLSPKDTPTEEEHSDTNESSTDYESALLPLLLPEDKHKRCLVLDLDETLVHSSFKVILHLEIDGVVHRVYVLKRPFVDEFLVECSKYYELVIFTASLSKYADPLLDYLDTQHDMRRIGRRLKDTIIVDNSPHSYCFQPKNAVPIASWFDDKSDTQVESSPDGRKRICTIPNVLCCFALTAERIHACVEDNIAASQGCQECAGCT